MILQTVLIEIERRRALKADKEEVPILTAEYETGDDFVNVTLYSLTDVVGFSVTAKDLIALGAAVAALTSSK